MFADNRPRFLRDLFVALTCYSLVIAPFGCQLAPLNPGPGSDSPNRSGLFISDGASEGIVLSGRSTAGEFFVFGERGADGRLSRIDAIALRGPYGESSLVFENGRPVYASGPDGSYAHVSYEEVSSERLAAAVEFYNAETGEKQNLSADVDLTKTLAQVAAEIRAATGESLETTSETEATLAAGVGDADKSHGDRVRITIIDPLFSLTVLPFVAAVGLMTVVLGQVILAMYIAVAAVVQLAVLIVLSPLILLNEILSSSIFRIELVTFGDLFRNPPPPPAIIIF